MSYQPEYVDFEAVNTYGASGRCREENARVGLAPASHSTAVGLTRALRNPSMEKTKMMLTEIKFRQNADNPMSRRQYRARGGGNIELEEEAI